MLATRLHCVIDSNVLIDLKVGGILRALFELPLRLLTTDFLVVELHEPDGQQLQRHGLIVCELSAEAVQEIFRIKSQYPGPSIADLSAIVLAKTANAILLTGERNLRAIAEQEGVPVHGTLWLLDEMVRHNVLSPFVASQALSRMLRGGSRLPKSECEKRLARWKALDQT